MTTDKLKLPLIESLKYIRIRYFGDSAADLGRICTPPLGRTTMHRIFKGEATRPAHRLAIMLIEQGFSEEFLYEGRGEARTEALYEISDGNEVITRPIVYKGKKIIAVLIISEIQQTAGGDLVEINGTWRGVAAPVFKTVKDQ